MNSIIQYDVNGIMSIIVKSNCLLFVSVTRKLIHVLATRSFAAMFISSLVFLINGFLCLFIFDILWTTQLNNLG